MTSSLLIADQKSPSWNFALKIQEYIQERYFSLIPLQNVEINHFRNGEIDMHVPDNLRKKDIYFIHDSTKNPQEWWVELILIKDLLLSSSANTLTFVLPDMLYSRKDRKDKARVPISARALSKTISDGVKRIITMDLHASQIQGFYPEKTPLDNLYSYPEFVKYLRKNFFDDLKNLVVVSPDVGGVIRAKSFLTRLSNENHNDSHHHTYSFALLSKTRPKPGEVSDDIQLVGDVEGKNVLIIDDIIDSGNTLIKASNLLKEKGALKMYCYATHGIFTQGTKDLVSSFDKIFVSNTHNLMHQGISIVDVSSVFAESIYRDEKGISISELFK